MEWWDIFLVLFDPVGTNLLLSNAADHLDPFLTTVYPSSDGRFQQDNAISQCCACHQISLRTFSDVVEREIHIMDLHHERAANKSAATVWHYYVSMIKISEHRF